MHGVLRAEIQGDGAEPDAGVVDGLDPYRARLVRVVDDANEAVKLGPRRQHQRQGMRGGGPNRREPRPERPQRLQADTRLAVPSSSSPNLPSRS